MMNLSCYFCNNDKQNLSKARESTYFYCDNCCRIYDLNDVITILPKYVHIFTIKKNITYQVRLHLESNFTKIICLDSSLDSLLTVPGFTINPSNVKDKLKTYLLFS